MVGKLVGIKEKSPERRIKTTYMAEWTGLEPATPGVTGRYSNQLNYHSAWLTAAQLSLQVLPKLGVP